MANKQNFTPEEWTKVLEGTLVAGMAVSAADPSGLWGTLKEAFASKSALDAAKLDSGSSELVKAVVADFETTGGRSAIEEGLRKHFAGAEASEFVRRSLNILREVSAIVDTKAPGDAAAFKAWLRGISHNVAEAAMEGGVLGLGGVRVSDAEKATLADIAKALGTAAQPRTS
jgi:hypothetical protein